MSDEEAKFSGEFQFHFQFHSVSLFLAFTHY